MRWKSCKASPWTRSTSSKSAAKRASARPRITAGGVELKLAVVHGLKNAIDVVEKIRRGKCRYDLIEVMACPGGCVCGAGQPVTRDTDGRLLRAKGLYAADKMMQLHKSQDNHMVTECYAKYLEQPGSHTAHKLLHTDLPEPAADLRRVARGARRRSQQNQKAVPSPSASARVASSAAAQTLLRSL